MKCRLVSSVQIVPFKHKCPVRFFPCVPCRGDLARFGPIGMQTGDSRDASTDLVSVRWPDPGYRGR